jgi:hypothetical protein
MNDLDLRAALHRDAELAGEPSPDLLDQLALRSDRQRRQRAGMLATALAVVVIAAGIPVGQSLLAQGDGGPVDQAPVITTPSVDPTPTGAPEPTPVPEVPPSPQATPSANTQRAKVVSADEVYWLLSPSGNINCSMTHLGAVCEIRNPTYEPPVKPSECYLDHGSMIEVRGETPAEFVCHGDTGFGIDAPVLGYGERVSNGIVTCVSARTGMSCSTVSGSHGFELSRASYRLY